jgi:DNA primase
MIPAKTIDEIRERADIISVISEYVPLKKRGKNYLGSCPFHSEKTPSFTVNQDKKLFHCFGCGEGGNIFAFIMKIENIGFAEAVGLLGEKTGIEVPRYARSQDANSKGERLSEAIKLAAEHFQKNLQQEHAGESAREYLKKRGIDERTAAAFKLGFSLDSWDALTKHLLSRGVDTKDIEAAGLALSKEGGGLYDRFRGRLMFAIEDARGRDVGFGGRILSEGEPKYLNSPETQVYNKSRLLYGLNLSKDFIKAENLAVVVEGYMDVIACYQFGIKNVVASMGTALTDEQIKLISRFTSNVALVYDKDPAGEAATQRGVDLLRKASINVKVARITFGKDPDELIRTKGPGALKDALSSALPWLEYLINSSISRFDLREIEQRVKALREASRLIAQERDALTRSEFVKYAAKLLGSREDAIAEEVKKELFYSAKSTKKSEARSIKEKPAPKINRAEEAALELSITNPDALKILKGSVHWGEFTDPVNRTIAELIMSVEAEGKDLAKFLEDNLPSEEAKKRLSAILLSESPTDNVERTIKDYINAIKAHHVKLRIADLRSKIEEAERICDIEGVKALHMDFSQASSFLRSLQGSV